MSKFLRFNDKLYTLVDSADEITTPAPEAKADTAEVEVVKESPAEIVEKMQRLHIELEAEIEKLKHELQGGNNG